MKVPFYGHVEQYQGLKNEIDANMQEVLMSGKYIMGPMLDKFEKELKEYFGTKYAIGVGNGTDAIWLTLMALGVGPGDEVITNANTFYATAEAIWIAGATAVLVDCTEDTRCIDPEEVAKAVTDKTKAIIPVHLYGHCADMKAISKIAKDNDLYVIEDNAQSIDGHGDGFKQGELSDAVTTSFIIQKNLGTFGDGGAVVTNCEKIDSEVRRLRNHGSTKRDIHSFGFNSRLDDIHAGVLSAKIKKITEWTDLRRKLAKQYDEGLKDTKLKLPVELDGYRHVYHLYVVETDNAEKRNALLKFLNDNDIDAKTHYSVAIHNQEGFPWGKQFKIPGSLENSEENAACCVSLPMFPELSAEQVDYTIGKVKEWDQANN